MDGQLTERQQKAMQRIVQADFFVSATLKDGRGSITTNTSSDEKAIELMEQVIKILKSKTNGPKDNIG